jgi:hypothetical protein
MATLKGTDVEVIGSGNTTGASLGGSISERISFYGVTPVAQPASALQAAAGTTASTTSSPAGCSTTTQMTALINLVDQMRACLVNSGLMKGAA